MTNYKWVTLTSDGKLEEKPVIAFITPASGFYGVVGQKKIKERLKILTDAGFVVKVPVFSVDENGSDIAEFPNEINFDVAEQRNIFTQMQVVVEPNVVGRNEPEFPEVAPLANSPETGARIVIDCVENGWNMMPLIGGAGFEHKIPFIRKYFVQNPQKKNPEIIMFGYSNISCANSLMLDGICFYMPTGFTNNFSKIADIKAKQQKQGLSDGEEKWLTYLESQIVKLKSALTNPKTIDEGNRKIIFCPKATNVNVMHYPMNIDVLTALELDPNLFMPNPQEKWSFAVEWMMQRGDNPAVFSDAVKMLDRFLAKNKNHLPEFIELGVLGTRFDGLNGIWDLIHDKNGAIEVSNTNVDIILFKEPVKKGFVRKLNEFLVKYKNCSDEDKALHGALPGFLQNKLNTNTKVEENISAAEIKDIFKWQNEVFHRVVGEVSEVAKKYNLPLVLNLNYGHVANMSPNVSGPCEARFDRHEFSLTKLRDRALVDDAEEKQQPKSSVKYAAIGKHGNIKSRL